MCIFMSFTFTSLIEMKIKIPFRFRGYFRDYHKDEYSSNAGILHSHQGNRHDKGRLSFFIQKSIQIVR